MTEHQISIVRTTISEREEITGPDGSVTDGRSWSHDTYQYRCSCGISGLEFPDGDLEDGSECDARALAVRNGRTHVAWMEPGPERDALDAGFSAFLRGCGK